MWVAPFSIMGKELAKPAGLRVFSIIISLVLVSSSLSHFVPRGTASSHPRNGYEAWNAGFRGIIEPDNPVVLQQLHNLCPTIDEEHFTANFLAVYTYSMLIPYAYDSDVYGVNDYWQTSEETILLGHGDCEDQAINLATLIEALYKETYGYVPSNLVWVVLGNVTVLGGEGGHGWVLVNEGALPKQTIEEIKSVSILEAIINIILGGYVGIQDLYTEIRHEIEVSLDLSTLPSKNNLQSLSLFYSGERYFELEPTWNLPISEYYFKKYPYTYVYGIFNSQGYDLDPEFYPTEQAPYLAAEIKNIAFPIRIIVGDQFTINVTVQNYDCGYLGADLVVILKNYGVEVARQDAYVYKYWWQIQTFVFNLFAVEPAQTEQVSVELYWHNYWWPFIDDWFLEDYRNLTMQTISNRPDLVPYAGFTLPKNASEGELLTFNFLGQNQGPMPAGPFATSIFIDSVLFDTVWVAGCGGFSGFQLQTKPWTAVVGEHSVGIVVDSTNVISEYDETNNEMVMSIEIAHNETIYIEPDGNVFPSSAPISSLDKVTYTFTADISFPSYYGVVVQRSNIVIDGKGHTLQGNSSGYGLHLSNVSNVTIKSTSSRNFTVGIWLYYSSGIIVSGNSVANCIYGIDLGGSNSSNIVGNDVTANSQDGIYLGSSSNYNSISGNNITNNLDGIVLDSSSSNSISGNNITNNWEGIYLYSSSNNKLYHNNFINNGVQVYSEDSANVWDDSYPSGGNYWNDYAGVDEKKGINQDEPGSDGLGDTPYVIDSNNQDHYPLMKPYPWASHDIGITSVTTSKTIVGQGYNVSISIMTFNYGNCTENINVTIYASTTVIGEINNIEVASRNFTIVQYTWSTSGFVKGKYSMKAVADTVQGETDILDNSYTGGWIFITRVGRKYQWL